MENSRIDLVILLTGTITPNTPSNLKIIDPVIRRQQYLEAINFYIAKTKFKIVFAENSNDKLENFPVLLDRIEYLTFNSTPVQLDRGKGYKELGIIEFAIQNSNFLKKTDFVVKITGRLKVLNLNILSKKFLKLASKKCNLIYADPFELNNIDSRCFFFTLDFWPYLKKAGRDINLRYNFELSLWDAIKEYQRIEGNNFIPLKYPLRIEGISGSFGAKYKHSIWLHFGRYIRNFSLGIFNDRSMLE